MIIKYRFWDGQQMIYDQEQVFQMLTDNCDPTNGFSNMRRLFMQFTGLRDEFGNELYDGDCVLIHSAGWEKNLFEIRLEPGGFKLISPRFPTMPAIESIANILERIGNVFII